MDVITHFPVVEAIVLVINRKVVTDQVEDAKEVVPVVGRIGHPVKLKHCIVVLISQYKCRI